MGDIVLVGAAGHARRLDLLAVDAGDDDGYRNVLPGYHELRVRGDGVWHVAGFVLAPDDDCIAVAALRLDGARLVDARDQPQPPRAQLRDVLSAHASAARAWQTTTSAIGEPLTAPPPSAPSLAALQASFVWHALHGGALTLLRAQVAGLSDVTQLLRAPDDGADAGHSVAAMLTLLPELRTQLPIDDLIGALSDAGSGRPRLLAAANALQLQSIQ